jgi:hypothetical protein
VALPANDAPVAVKDLKVGWSAADGLLRFSLRVLNTRTDKQPATGSVFIQLNSTASDESRSYQLPTATWVAEDHRPRQGGYAFSINNFKDITFKPRKFMQDPEFSKARVIIVSKTGDIYLDEQISLQPLQ